jgi:hypothetical protein
MNYEPFLERDVEGIRAECRATPDPGALFLEVARFAVLAYAPSQHSKHALLACLAAHDLRERCGARWPALIEECAIYAAESRQPWSEPPILDPPEASAERGIEELRAAVAEGDRLRAERWLAGRLDDGESDLLEAATDDFEDLGHKLIVTAAALRLAPILGAKGRFATLRVAVWEMCAYRGETARFAPAAGDPRERLVLHALAERGSIESMHAIFLYDAARGTSVEERVRGYLDSFTPPAPALVAASSASSVPLPIYPLARDYAAFLKSSAVGLRWNDPRVSLAAKENLDHASGFEEWTFA